jgi:hypothetical protein
MVQVNWHGDEVKKSAEEAALDGLEELMRTLIATDSDIHCPVDTSNMKNTRDIQRDDSEKEIVIGYGGPATPYTLKQHDDASLHHHDGQTDHWLENAFNAHVGEAESYMAKHVDGILK